MKALFVSSLLAIALAGCSTWGTRTATQQPSQGATGSSITPSPTGISSHNRAD